MELSDIEDPGIAQEYKHKRCRMGNGNGTTSVGVVLKLKLKPKPDNNENKNSLASVAAGLVITWPVSVMVQQHKDSGGWKGGYLCACYLAR